MWDEITYPSPMEFPIHGEINSSPPSAASMRQWIDWALLQIMAWRLFGTKQLSKPMLQYYQLDP